MRILIADDQAQVRFALRVLLAQQPGLAVVGEALSTRELLNAVAASCPDLVLLDWELPGQVAARFLPTLRRSCPDVIVIALSGRTEAQQAALVAGADAFVSKADPPEQLLTAIGACRLHAHSSVKPTASTL